MRLRYDDRLLGPTEKMLAERLRGEDSATADYHATAGRYANDPTGYARDILGIELTPQQQTIAGKLLEPPYRVLVPSANNQGKTLLAAVICSWFFDNYDPSIVQATAPTARQVHDLLFKELRRLRSAPAACAGFLPKADRIERSPEHFVNGFTANNADSFQGTHAANLGLVFDEATGIDQAFWGRAETMFGGHPGHWWLSIYNPNDSSSPAYAAEETGLWHVVRLNALEHINVLTELAGGEPPIPSAIRLNRVLDRIKVECDALEPGAEDPLTDFQFPAGGPWYRPKTPDFEAQVLGRWPLIPTESLFSHALVDKCAAAARPLDRDWMPQVGCDVARFGNDKTTIMARAGPCVLRLESHYHRDTTWIAHRLAVVCMELAAELGSDPSVSRRIPIVVDGTGGYGAGVVDQLPGYQVLDLSMSAKSPDPRCLRMRSYLWFKLAEYAHANLLDLSRLDGAILRELRGDLVAPRYRIDNENRRVLEPKDQIKSRLGRSPDLGDALTLAFYTG